MTKRAPNIASVAPFGALPPAPPAPVAGAEVVAAIGPVLAYVARLVAAEIVASMPPPAAPAAPAPLVDKRELARLLNVSSATIDRLDREGQPFVRIGDAKRYDFAAVLAWHRERPAPAEAPALPASTAPEAPASGVRSLSRRRAGGGQ